MSFQDAVRVVLTQKYADFTGRARRSEYWWFYLATLLAAVGFWIVAGILIAVLSAVSDTLGQAVLVVALIVYLVAALGIILPSLAVLVRRLHDTDRSAWWLLIYFVPVAGFVVLLVFLVLDSGPDNRFGPSPKNAGGGIAGYDQSYPQAYGQQYPQQGDQGHYPPQ